MDKSTLKDILILFLFLLFINLSTILIMKIPLALKMFSSGVIVGISISLILYYMVFIRKS